ELASLVVPNGASAVQPSSSSHSACSMKRSGSGAPSSPMGVNTGAITPEKVGGTFMATILVLLICEVVSIRVTTRSWHRDGWLRDRYVIALLYSGPLGDCAVPAQHVRKLVEI